MGGRISQIEYATCLDQIFINYEDFDSNLPNRKFKKNYAL